MKITDAAHAVRVIDFMAGKYKEFAESPNGKDSPSYSRVAWLALSELAAQWKAGPDGINGEAERIGADLKMDNVVECVAAEILDEMIRLGKVQEFEIPE